jgi:AcrR family transcriptional regulator
MSATEPNETQRTDARRNREAILAAALAALTDSPGASLNAIAKRAGVANATLYRHFPTREELVLATYEREVGKLVDAADVLLREQAPLDALRTWVQRLAASGHQARARRRPAKVITPKRPVLDEHVRRDRPQP